MVGRVMGVMVLGCMLGSTGCRKTERTSAAEKPEVAATQTKKLETREMAETAPMALEAKPGAAPVRTAAPMRMAPMAPVGAAEGPIALQESTTRTRQAAAPAQAPAGPERDGEDRIWLSESAEAARAGNVNISADADTEDITIASGSVEGRVKRVRKHTIEVNDREGNTYELRIDRRSRGLRQGRKVALNRIAEGTPVRASFDLTGGGDSLARDIVLRR